MKKCIDVANFRPKKCIDKKFGLEYNKKKVDFFGRLRWNVW